MIEARLQLPRGGFELDVDLRLPGEGVSVLFGPSGCGKTTVLRALAGLERAAGRVALGGEVWQDDAAGLFLPPHRRPIGYVIQEAALFPHLDVRRNLEYGRKRSGADGARVDLDAVVDLLGIAPLLARRPTTLSGGERQRVAIARALATGPRLLLMDEPLAALDAARKAEILPYLERLHRRLALPVVYVTHSMDEAARLADHLVLLEAGRRLADGPLGELTARTDLPLARHDDAGVVLEAQVAERDEAYGLVRLAIEGGSLWIGAPPALDAGEPLRARLLARDVSVTRQHPSETSLLNVLPVRLEEIVPDGVTVLLRLRACAGHAAGHDTEGEGATAGADRARAAVILSRITRKSREALALQPGDLLFAQIKGVALM